MYDNSLSPCQERETPPFSVIDIETKKGTWDKFDFCGHYDGNKYSVYDDLYSLTEKILSDKNKLTYAHFLDFDGMFLLDHAIECEEITAIPIISARMISLEMSDGEREATINDSYSILPASLKKLFKEYDVPFEKKSLDDIYARNYDDCLGLYEVLKRHFAHESIYGISTSQRSMNVFRSRFLTRKIYDNPSLDKLIRLGYYGGRTEIFKFNLDIDKRFFLYDVNSLYPSCMKDHVFPLGKLRKAKPDELNEIEGFGKISFEDTSNFPLLPMRAFNKLFFPSGRHEGIYSIPEIREMKELGQKIKIEWLYGTNNFDSIFDGYINYYYEEKAKVEEEGNKIKRQNAKLMMNSLSPCFFP